MKNKNVIISLVGLPASYKSFLGKLLAEFLQFQPLDLDKIISNHLGLSVVEIFEKFGEEYFRKIEEKLFFENINNPNNIVFSLGGGSFINNNIREYLKTNCLNVFLNTDIDIIAENIWQEKNNRPMFKNTKNLNEVIEALNLIKKNRIKYYLEAKYKIDIHHKIYTSNSLETVKKIVEILGL